MTKKNKMISWFSLSLAPHRLVLHELDLQPGDLRPQNADLLAGLVLVQHHFVLDVPRSVGVLQRVQRLHEVPVRRADAGDHHRLAGVKHRQIFIICLVQLQNYNANLIKCFQSQSQSLFIYIAHLKQP